MDKDWVPANKAVNAGSQIEEACLAILLEERTRGRHAGGVSTADVAARIGPERWLGVCVTEIVVERILLEAGKVERHSIGPMPEGWEITDDEAMIRLPSRPGRAWLSFEPGP